MSEPDEIRRDLVLFQPQSSSSVIDTLRKFLSPQQKLATMVLTRREIIFVPPERTEAKSLIRRTMIGFASPTPLRERRSFQLAKITHLRPLTLEWGGTFQIGVDGWSFQLRTNDWPLEVLSSGVREQHFAAVKDAWLAARAKGADQAV